MKKLYSLYLYFVIQIQRTIDHLWRHATGFPALKRSAITPNLYLGGQYKINSVAMLRRLGITAIVSMRMREVPHQDMLTEFHLLHLPTPDRHAPSMMDLKKGVFFIEKEIKNNGKVYVHCRAGEGRGPTMVIAYLLYSGMLYDDAVALIKKTRTFINPTPVQVERLKEFEEWVKNGVLSH
jgi:protein-tyrosine phosphatase